MSEENYQELINKYQEKIKKIFPDIDLESNENLVMEFFKHDKSEWQIVKKGLIIGWKTEYLQIFWSAIRDFRETPLIKKANKYDFSWFRFPEFFKIEDVNDVGKENIAKFDYNFWKRNEVLAFSNMVDFSGAEFQGKSSFSGVIFRDYAIFSGAVFQGNVSFGHTTFKMTSLFDRLKNKFPVKFNGKANFGHANFQGKTFFDHTIFRKKADFRNTVFSDRFKTEFLKIQFFGKFLVSKATFSEQVVFDRFNFRKIDLDKANGGDKIQKIYYTNVWQWVRSKWKKIGFWGLVGLLLGLLAWFFPEQGKQVGEFIVDVFK